MLATSQEPEREALTINSQNSKEAIGIHQVFIMKVKLQREHFLEK